MSSTYYDQPTLWDAAPSAAQVDVAQALKAMIPADVRTVLDAGCGSGIVTNVLIDAWEVMGCDISQTALAQVKAPTIQADLTNLPFEDRNFDLVLSSDVIEHIPDSVYRTAINEIARVAGKYILIAVPYREILEASAVQCPNCRTRFHAHYHQRSYSAADFDGLFPADFEVIATDLAGERWPFSNATLAQTGLQLSDLDYDFPSAICPSCGTLRGARVPSAHMGILEKQLAALQYMRCEHGLEAAPPPSELLVLLKRRDGGTAASPRPIEEPEFSGEFERHETIALGDCARLGHLLNFPRQSYIVPDGDQFDVLLLPALPEVFFAESEQALAPVLHAYDAVSEEYVPIPAQRQEGGQWAFRCPAVCPSTAGYRIRIPKSAGLSLLRFQWPKPLDLAQCFNRAFEFGVAALKMRAQLETQRREYQEKIDSLNQLANDIEARRAAAEEKLSK